VRHKRGLGIQRLNWQDLPALLLFSDRRVTAATVVGLCLIAGGLLGTMLGFLGPLLTAATIVGAIGAVLMLRDVKWGFYAVVAVSTLLPFGAAGSSSHMFTSSGYRVLHGGSLYGISSNRSFIVVPTW